MINVWNNRLVRVSENSYSDNFVKFENIFQTRANWKLPQINRFIRLMESILKVGLGFVIQIRCIVYIIPQNLCPKFEMNIPL